MVGRFQQASQVEFEKLKRMLQAKPALQNLPIVSGVDFGHTDPKITFPIGGKVKLSCINGIVKLEIIEH